MVQFIFRGNNADGHVVVGGVRFQKDAPQDIANEAWIAKLDANPEFERAGGPTEASPPPFGGGSELSDASDDGEGKAEPGPEDDPSLDAVDEPSDQAELGGSETTDEGPKKPKKK